MLAACLYSAFKPMDGNTLKKKYDTVAIHILKAESREKATG